MATQLPGADNQSSTAQGSQVFGPEPEMSVSRLVDLNFSVTTPVTTYNPYMLMQQVGTQSYPIFQIADSQQLHSDQQSYVPSSIHVGNIYAAPALVHHGYQSYRPSVQEQLQGYAGLQQQNFMQQAESYVQSGQTTFDTGNQGQMQRILPRSLPHVRQRIRRRNRTNRGIISNVHSVAAGIEHNNREQNTATSITGNSSM